MKLPTFYDPLLCPECVTIGDIIAVWNTELLRPEQQFVIDSIACDKLTGRYICGATLTSQQADWPANTPFKKLYSLI